MSTPSFASTQPVTPPVTPLFGFDPRLFEVLLVLPASPAVPPSDCTALHGARPLVPDIVRIETSLKFLIGKSSNRDSSTGSTTAFSLSNPAVASGVNAIIIIRAARRYGRVRMVLNPRPSSCVGYECTVFCSDTVLCTVLNKFTDLHFGSG